MIPVYVGGKGLGAGERTLAFKRYVLGALESSGKAWDTRYRHYRELYPRLPEDAFIRMVCDPVEFYDPGWEAWAAARGGRREEALAAFLHERDGAFRERARAAILCLDEAGFGTGVNALRFLQAGKPVLGFHGLTTPNAANFLQLREEFPALATIAAYRSLEEVGRRLRDWLAELERRGGAAR